MAQAMTGEVYPLPASLRSATFPRGEGFGAVIFWSAPALQSRLCKFHHFDYKKLFSEITEKSYGFL